MNKEEVARRLAYLLNTRENNPKMYSQNGLGREKEDLMMRYGYNDEVMRITRKLLK